MKPPSPPFKFTHELAATEIAKSNSGGINRLPWGSTRIMRKAHWKDYDPKLSAFYWVKAPADFEWFLQDLAHVVVGGHNQALHLGQGYFQVTPASLRRLQEVFALLGVQKFLFTCDGEDEWELVHIPTQWQTL